MAIRRGPEPLDSRRSTRPQPARPAPRCASKLARPSEKLGFLRRRRCRFQLLIAEDEAVTVAIELDYIDVFQEARTVEIDGPDRHPGIVGADRLQHQAPALAVGLTRDVERT